MTVIVRLTASGKAPGDDINRVVGEVGGSILYLHESKERDWIMFLELPEESAKAAINAVVTFAEKSRVYRNISAANSLVFPLKDFHERQNPTPQRLRVCGLTPVVSRFDVTYTFSTPAERDLLFRVYKDFRENVDYTHFACVPIAPCFPEFTTALNDLGTRCGFVEAKRNAGALFHLTLVMFIVHSDDEIATISAIMDEALREVEWPSDRILRFCELQTFGRPDQTRILYAKPEGELLGALAQYVAKLAEKARDHGLTKISETDIFHGTFARPSFLGQKSRFDARPMIDAFSPDCLPPVDISELRFVKRGQFDDDQFYHTEARFPLP